MKIENTVTVSHQGEDNADHSPAHKTFNARNSKEFNSTGRNLQTMLQKRTYRNISSHVRKHKMNHQCHTSASTLPRNNIPSTFAIDSIKQKMANKRAGYLSQKLAMIQEEIERANSGQIREQSDEQTEPITSQEQQIHPNQNLMSNEVAKIPNNRQNKKRQPLTSSEKQALEQSQRNPKDLNQILDKSPAQESVQGCKQNTMFASPSKKGNRPHITISVNGTRIGGVNQESSCSPDISPSPVMRRINGREGKETMPARTFDESREDEIIQMIEYHQKHRLEVDPMRELEEALMDRTTASLNRRNKVYVCKKGAVTQADVLQEVQQQPLIQPTFIQIDLDSSEPLRTLSAQEAANYCHDLYPNNRGEGQLSKKASAPQTSPSIKGQGFESGFSVPKFQLDHKRCPMEETSMSGREDGETDIEEPNLKKRRALHKAVYVYSSSEQANRGQSKDIEGKSDSNLKSKSYCLPQKSNQKKFDLESDKILQDSCEKETRPTNSLGNAKFRSTSTRNIHMQNDSNYLDDSNQILNNGVQCGDSSDDIQTNLGDKKVNNEDCFLQSGANPIAKNILKDLQSKNQMSDYIEYDQNMQSNLVESDQAVNLQEQIQNKRTIKGFRKKLTAQQVRKIVYQTLETGQQADDQNSHHESQNRMWNDDKNSEGMLDDLQENLADFEEEEKSYKCNYNIATAIDQSATANQRKYKNCPNNQINLDLLQKHGTMSSQQRNYNFNIPQNLQNQKSNNTPQSLINNKNITNQPRIAAGKYPDHNNNNITKQSSHSTDSQVQTNWRANRYQQDLNLLNNSCKLLPRRASQETSGQQSYQHINEKKHQRQECEDSSLSNDKQQYIKNSKFFGLKNNIQQSASLQNIDNCFKNTLLKMLGLSNTLSLWNLKQNNDRQQTLQFVTNNSSQLQNGLQNQGAHNLNNMIRLARAQQFAQIAQRQQVVEIQARMQVAMQAQAVQKKLAILNQLNSVDQATAGQFNDANQVMLPFLQPYFNKQSSLDLQDPSQLNAPSQLEQANALQLQQQLMRNKLTNGDAQFDQEGILEQQQRIQLTAQWLQMMQQKC